MLKFANHFNRLIFLNSTILRKLRRANASSYQFRIERPYYYPNRENERKRAESQQAALERQNVVDGVPSPRPDLRESYRLMTGQRKQSTLEQIKSAYYNLAKRFHRDANRNSYEMQCFKELSSIYKAIIDESNRMEQQDKDHVKEREQAFLRSVDELFKSIAMEEKKIASEKSKKASDASNNELKTNAANAENLSTEELLKLANSEPKIELTFEEAAQGLKRNYPLRFVKKCTACLGKSPMLSNRSNPEICRKCCGTGSVTKHTATYTSTVICDRCNGSKFIKRDQCAICGNRGLVLDNTSIQLTLPPGIKTGDTVTAENPVTKKRVSFYVQVHDSKYFQRIGNDVHTVKYISLPDAILGCNCNIRGLYGNISFKVPPGSDSHSQIINKGKGVKTYDGCIGDHIVTVKVAIPKGLSTRQRQLILSLAQTEDQPIEYDD